jgi:hypothetical protein
MLCPVRRASGRQSGNPSRTVTSGRLTARLLHGRRALEPSARHHEVGLLHRRTRGYLSADPHSRVCASPGLVGGSPSQSSRPSVPPSKPIYVPFGPLVRPRTKARLVAGPRRLGTPFPLGRSTPRRLPPRARRLVRPLRRERQHSVSIGGQARTRRANPVDSAPRSACPHPNRSKCSPLEIRVSAKRPTHKRPILHGDRSLLHCLELDAHRQSDDQSVSDCCSLRFSSKSQSSLL